MEFLTIFLRFFLTKFHLAATVTVLIEYICFCFALICSFFFIFDGRMKKQQLWKFIGKYL